MHEMALTLGLIDLVRDEKKTHGFDRVRRVVVELGKLGHVDPHALKFAFEAAAPGSPIDGAELDIREIDGKAWCMDCSATVQVDRRGDACPQCGSYMLVLEQGDDLKLKELEVA